MGEDHQVTFTSSSLTHIVNLLQSPESALYTGCETPGRKKTKMRFLLLLISLKIFSPSLGQSDIESRNLFEKGIYVENLNLLIPWGIKFNEISKYGNPEIMCNSKTYTQLKWNSALILDSTIIDFRCFYFRCFLRREPTGIFNTIYGSIDSIQISKLKNHFEEYANTKGKLTKKKNNQYYYYWVIDNCNVKLGYNKVEKAYLKIQKK